MFLPLDSCSLLEGFLPPSAADPLATATTTEIASSPEESMVPSNCGAFPFGAEFQSPKKGLGLSILSFPVMKVMLP
jgi:hypothetical protein